MRVNAILRTSGNTVALVGGTVARMVANFAFVLFAAADMGVTNFGRYSLAIFYFELFLSLAATSIGILLTRDLARWRRCSNDLFTSASVLALGMAALAIPSMWVVSRFLQYSADTSQAILIAAIALLPGALAVLCEAAFVAYERAAYVTAGNVLESLLRIPLSVAVLMLGFDWVHVMWVFLAARIALFGFYLWGLSRLWPLRIRLRRRTLPRYVARWRVFAAENWMATLYTNLDGFVLSTLCGEAVFGLYSAAWKVVRLGSIFAKSYTTAVYPLMTRMYGKSRDAFGRLYRQTIRGMAIVALPVVVVICLMSPAVIKLLYTDEYTEAIPILRVLVWALLVEFLNPFLSHALFAQGKQRKSMHTAAISLAVNSVLTVALVHRFGAVGAALGTVFGGLVATVCYSFFLMPPAERTATLVVISRIGVAAVGLGTTLVAFAAKPLWVQGGIGLTVYTSLLLIVGVVRFSDARELKKLVLQRTS